MNAAVITTYELMYKLLNLGEASQTAQSQAALRDELARRSGLSANATVEELVKWFCTSAPDVDEYQKDYIRIGSSITQAKQATYRKVGLKQGQLDEGSFKTYHFPKRHPIADAVQEAMTRNAFVQIRVPGKGGKSWIREHRDVIWCVWLNKQESSRAYFINLGIRLPGIDPEGFDNRMWHASTSLAKSMLTTGDKRELEQILDMRSKVSNDERRRRVIEVIDKVALPLLQSCDTFPHAKHTLLNTKKFFVSSFVQRALREQSSIRLAVQKARREQSSS